MSIKQLSVIYSTKIENIGKHTNPCFPNIIEIYKKSIVDWNDLWEAMTVISVKTSNNLKIINKLPYYEFVTLSKYLNKYIEAENKQGGTENAEDQQNSVMNQSNKMMGNAKNMLKSGNMPKMPK